VGVYVCGMTVDAEPHLGHVRSVVVFDVLVRALRAEGLHVTHVRNVTDVDDRILRRASAEGVAPEALAERNLAAFRAVTDALGAAPPDLEPRVTRSMGEIVALVEELVARGHAYAAGGSVWFDVPSSPRYGRLSRRDPADQREAVRIEPHPSKRHPADFALWKASEAPEPGWPSPWGRGRPGWHVECSAMARAALGAVIDVHGGGLDLLFPHHENEVAQTEAATGVEPSVRHWVHHGLLTVGAEKMAKSAGNGLSAASVLAAHHPESVRLWLLQARYRSPLELSLPALADAGTALSRLYDALERLAEGDGHDARAADAVVGTTSRARAAVRDALRDDLDTPAAVAALLEGARRAAAEAAGAPRAARTAAAAALAEAGAPLGLLRRSPAAFRAETSARRRARGGVPSSAEVEEALAARAEARRRGDYAASDRIKADLAARGIEVRDGPAGTTWRVARAE
jgi:cysteinyl-tRNA synthetase